MRSLSVEQQVRAVFASAAAAYGVRVAVRPDADLWRAAGSRGARWIIYPDGFTEARPFLVVFQRRRRRAWAHFSASAFAELERAPDRASRLLGALMGVLDACRKPPCGPTADAA